MKSITRVFLSLATAAIFSSSFIAPASAIENGAVAIGEPVIGLFFEGNRSITCSGAVLTPRIVVTAHHCIPNAGEDSEFYLKRKMLVSEPGKVITFDVGNKARVIEIVTKKEKWSLGICANGFCDDLDDIAFLILDRDYPVPANLKIASLEDILKFRADNAQVVTYGYGRMSFTEWSPGVPYKLSANLEEPNQGGYGTNAFNVSVKGIQNICSGDSGGPTYVLEGDFIYYVGPTSGTRRPSCIQEPMSVSGFFGGTFLAAKGALFTESQEKVIQIKVAAELKMKHEAEAKAEAELKAKQEADAKAAADLKAKQEADAKAAAELKAKQEADAKAAADLKAKQEADAKAAAELKAKQEADAKAAADKAALLKAQSDLAAANAKAAADREALVKLQADLAAANAKAAADREALVKSQADLAAANASLAAAQKTNRDLGAQLAAIESQFLVMSDSISTIQSQVLALNTKLTTTLKSLSTANAKIKKICSAKPKPKGC